MHWPDFHEVGLGGNLAAFGLASAVVWLAGDRLARCSQVIADRTRLGQAFIGTVLLGVTVSLPEMTLAAVAAALGNAALAVNSLLGGIAITMIVLAITDLAVGEEPLSIDVEHPVVLLQGALVIVMLTVAAGGMTAGDRLLPGVGVAGAWTTALGGLFIISLVLVERLQRYYPWRPDAVSEPQDGGAPREEPRPADGNAGAAEGRGLARVVWLTVLAAAAVVAGGSVLAFSADALAEQTGLGAGLVGLLFAASPPRCPS
jgi:cation:H+ antiporter